MDKMFLLLYTILLLAEKHEGGFNGVHTKHTGSRGMTGLHRWAYPFAIRQFSQQADNPANAHNCNSPGNGRTSSPVF